jgi:hypothetical protein
VVLASDVDLDLRPEALDRVGEDVLGAVADEVPGFGALAGEDPEAPALSKRLAQVDLAAVELGADGGPGEAGADPGGHLEGGGAALDGLDRSVGQGEVDLLRTHDSFLRLVPDWGGGVCQRVVRVRPAGATAGWW